MVLEEIKIRDSRYKVIAEDGEMLRIHGTPIAIYVRTKRPSDPFFSIDASTDLGFKDSLNIFRYIAEIDQPDSDEPISVPLLGAKRYGIGVDYAVLHAELEPVRPAQLALILGEPSPDNLQRYITTTRLTRYADSRTLVGYVSSERTVPNYLPEVLHRFMPQVPLETLSEGMSQLERRLISAFR